MDRKQYNSCMIPHMKGGGPDRKLRFCIGAKLCSGKSKTEEDAKEVCLLPKEPKPARASKGKRSTGQSCEKSVLTLAECVVTLLTENATYKNQALNINSVGAAVTNALMECQCPPAK